MLIPKIAPNCLMLSASGHIVLHWASAQLEALFVVQASHCGTELRLQYHTEFFLLL